MSGHLVQERTFHCCEPGMVQRDSVDIGLHEVSINAELGHLVHVGLLWCCDECHMVWMWTGKSWKPTTDFRHTAHCTHNDLWPVKPPKRKGKRGRRTKTQ